MFNCVYLVDAKNEHRRLLKTYETNEKKQTEIIQITIYALWGRRWFLANFIRDFERLHFGRRIFRLGPILTMLSSEDSPRDFAMQF